MEGVSYGLLPSHNEKTLNAMKAPRTVKRITFNPSEANPGETLNTRDIWREVSRFFMKEEHKPQHMTLQKFYANNKFGLLIDLRSMESQKMHGSGTRMVNTTDHGVQLEIEQDAKGSGQVNCHVFIISDAMFGIMNRQLESVQY